MDLVTAIKGLLDAEAKLRNAKAMTSPVIISEQMYRLGQYASAVEKHLGDLEEAYERDTAKRYMALIGKETKPTAAKQQVDAEFAELKGQIKKLTRYVKSAWNVHTSCMARINHLQAEMRGAV